MGFGPEVGGPAEFADGFRSLFAFALLLSAVHFVGLIVALVSIFQRTDQQVVGDSRVLWALVVLFVPFGFVAYSWSDAGDEPTGSPIRDRAIMPATMKA